jgi:hypothetical protein
MPTNGKAGIIVGQVEEQNPRPRHECNVEDAARFVYWIRHRGGVAV